MEFIRDFLSELLKPDTEIILVNGNIPIGKLLPANPTQPSPQVRVPDLYPTLWVSNDFDDLLPGEYWLTEQS